MVRRVMSSRSRSLFRRSEPADVRNACLCAAVALAAVALTVPTAGMGVNDAWSYALTVRDLARTGHFVYNGWATAMLGVQALWAALLVRLFGFSHDLVRASAAPFIAGCAALLYALHRRCGLPEAWAVFGALCVVLSPVFIPPASSFMTDVPGFLFWLLCVYGASRAVEAPQPEEAVLWMALVAVAGVFGGTIRQIVWAAPVALLPYAAWARRRRGGAGAFAVGAAAAGLTAAALLAAALCVVWYRSQPYALSEPVGTGAMLFLRNLPRSLVALLPLLFSLVLLVLPAFLAAGPAARALLARVGPVPAAVALLIGVGTPVLVFGPDGAVGPWLGNIVTFWGVTMPNETVIGDRPFALPFAVFAVVSLAVYAALALALLAGIAPLWRRRQSTADPEDPRGERPPAALGALLAATGIYLPLLLPRTVQGIAFDRYLIPALPAVTALVLRWAWGQGTGGTMPRRGGPAWGAWAALALFGLYGIAAEHDYFAAARARLAAAQEMTAAGIPRTAICAGMEYDAETQVAITGYVNDERILIPAGAYRPPTEPFPIMTGYAFWRWTPAVHPQYFVVLSPQKELTDDPRFPAVAYTAWLPPGRREVRVQTLPRP